MTKLCLGVIRKNYVLKDSNVTNTVTVANKLEDRYKIMNFFTVLKKKEIEDSVGNIFKESIWGQNSVTVPEIEPIQSSFKSMLSNRDLESVGIPGVPTKASLNAGRQSFIDTSLYMNCFRAKLK